MTTITLPVSDGLRGIPPVLDTLAELCEAQGLAPQVAMRLTLALDEVLTNVVSYGFEPDQAQDISVSFTIEDGWLETIVSDGGRPFDPLSLPPPDLDASLDERQVGGLGIHFMRQLMDNVSYQYSNGRNILTMKKNLVQQCPTK
ncbi:ATP-binding protein [Telmatospirillum sp. J64-1]|uniref:ATP-binding protein n=1 Tax=Telmatospirillum sp. J64-1 TaxID=2502183 RepID=UPI00115E52BC|nr:ATP-binding protein [Telmatospirillum sp. J64-1]